MGEEITIGIDYEVVPPEPYRLRRVPRRVRAIDPDAYTPMYVSIGPYHLGGDAGNHLRRRGLKMHYLRLLLRQVEKDHAKHQELVDSCLDHLRELKHRARRFYAEKLELDYEEFVWMLLLDGCFIIEHLYNYACGFNEPALYQTRWAPAQLRIDLGLLENQIPYFVLEALFEHLMPLDLKQSWAPQLEQSGGEELRRQLLQDMAMWYFLSGWYSLKATKLDELLPLVHPGEPIHHLLHLVHVSHCEMIRNRPPDELAGWCGDGLNKCVGALCILLMKLLTSCCAEKDRGSHENDDMKVNIASAVELRSLGVRFKKVPLSRGGLLDVRFSDDGTLEIPPLWVERVTAPLLHNLIALEQQFFPKPAGAEDTSMSREDAAPPGSPGAPDTRGYCTTCLPRSTPPHKPGAQPDFSVATDTSMPPEAAAQRPGYSEATDTSCCTACLRSSTPPPKPASQPDSSGAREASRLPEVAARRPGSAEAPATSCCCTACLCWSTPPATPSEHSDSAGAQGTRMPPEAAGRPPGGSVEAQDTNCCCMVWLRRSTLPPKPASQPDPSGAQDTGKSQDYFSTYAFLMYNLVNTREDIALLQKHGILQNNYGSDDQVITYFKNICLWNQRSPTGTHLEQVLKNLRKRTEQREYRDWGEMKKYCESPMTIVLVMVSIIAFFSTIVQAGSSLRVK